MEQRLSAIRDIFLPFSPPLLGDEEIAEVLDTLRSDWITTGPKVKRFEADFAAYIGAPSALAVSSATGAMLVGLAALGVGPGDAVITTPMTFCSTVHVIEHLGACPILVDVESDTLNIDPRQVEQALQSAIYSPQSAIKGIMPVHLPAMWRSTHRNSAAKSSAARWPRRCSAMGCACPPARR